MVQCTDWPGLGGSFTPRDVKWDGRRLGAPLGWNLPNGSRSWLAVGLTVDWVSTGVPGLRIPRPMALRVPWVSPSVVAIQRGRKQKLPDLFRARTQKYPIIQSRYKASLNSWIKKINSTSQREGNIHIRASRKEGRVLTVLGLGTLAVAAVDVALCPGQRLGRTGKGESRGARLL